jgi:hypothetical protein
MNNIKDTITNYAAIILLVVGAVQTFLQANAGKPIDWGQLTLFVIGAVCSYFIGKTPNGQTKTDVQVTAQNAPNPPKV